MIKLVPVIDILNGQVVRGIAGERDRYQPNRSKFVVDSNPVETARALIDSFDVETLYIADLDALTGSGSSADIISEISKQEVKTVVDAATTTACGVERMIEVGVDQVVIPLEAITSLGTLAEIAAVTDVNRLVFSLDLKSGEILGALAGKLRPLHLADEAYRLGFRKMIVLDLTSVGAAAGVSTTQLCQEIKASHAGFEIWTGGGVRSIEDIKELAQSGIDGVLVASALHDGHVPPETWQAFSSGE